MVQNDPFLVRRVILDTMKNTSRMSFEAVAALPSQVDVRTQGGSDSAETEAPTPLELYVAQNKDDFPEVVLLLLNRFAGIKGITALSHRIMHAY